MKKQKVLEGIVVSDKMTKTVVVKVIRKIRHPKYQKLVEKWKKYYAHDETDKIKEGSKVKIIQSRPLSKLKSWRVETVL
ncbi:MAG: 30S ribosomal protein S17 [Candidatus Anoxychlamydiales bacterium]|nr:30S ribosomal protein S17 [Candidatus Anoxychlamydiales bacterium]NGX35339.1 30S ribosomal protein S17 [Candidatus Anoxychlamydiales bacterium]